MWLIAFKVFFTLLGLILITGGVNHELGWWRKRKWIKSEGVIVGFKEESGCEGMYYYPEIQFEGPDGATRFTSRHASAGKPRIGKSVKILMESKSGGSAEHLTLSIRHFWTLVPIVFGLILVIAGICLVRVEMPGRTPVPAPSRGTPNSSSP
ncbi:MAG: hypothetical protein JWM59_196 [Verrucomicrobiales bacterium]|nr:hypothetical protein [Verrucomicrobiales bacterium]